MTKEITKARIIQEIEDKFKLRELIPEKFTFSEMVQPIYDIEQHILDSVSTNAVVSITASDGYLYFTVPENERWELHRYIVIFMGAGAITVSGVYLRRVKELAVTSIYLDLGVAKSISYLNDLPKSVVLDPGDSLHIFVDGYISTQNLKLYIDYTREVLR